MKPSTQLSLPGAPAKPLGKRIKRGGTITMIYPANAAVATIAGKWRRLPSGEIEARFTSEELELCERLGGLGE